MDSTMRAALALRCKGSAAGTAAGNSSRQQQQQSSNAACKLEFTVPWTFQDHDASHAPIAASLA